MLIPVFDEYDVLKYILGRSIYHNFNSPRYVCYGRRDRSVFFGLNMVQKKHPDAIVVEGPIDAMRLHDAGYHNVVAIVGSYLDIDPEWQAKADKLTIFSAVVLAFDGYPGGHPQQKKLADYLSSRSVAVKEIFLPAARDPADLDADELIYFFGSK
jgi:DNA primase